MRNFFGCINENFFNVFSCKHKNLYAECLIRLHDASLNCSDVHLPYNAAYEILDQVLEEYQEDGNDLSDTDEAGTTYSLDRAGIFRNLRKNGWIKTDYSDVKNDELIIFTPEANVFINAMKSMV